MRNDNSTKFQLAQNSCFTSFSNNFCFLELVDKVLFRMSNKHNNRRLSVSILFYNCHIRRKTDKHLLAYFLLFYVDSLDKQFLILIGLPLVFFFVDYFISCCANCFLDFRFVSFGFVKFYDCISIFVRCF
jgi:hypothetical protein